MSGFYRLSRAGKPIPVDFLEWAKWFETADRTVALTKIGRGAVSTVFIGLDMNHTGRGRPILWESMVFRGRLAGRSSRYASRRQAIAGHEALCRDVLAAARPASRRRRRQPARRQTRA